MDGLTLRERWRRDWPVALMLGLAAVVATWAYAQFWPAARDLWYSPSHDRNAHYWMAQSVGLDLSNGDVLHLARDIERMRIWGPTFPLVTGVILALGGPDYRLAVLTSMLAWVAAAFLAFLVARRAAPVGGNLAGLLAGVLVMASPAFHAYATDIMLEGPGACLSLAAVYAYLRARQDGSLASLRWFGVAMTALFLLKCNYWVLALFALLATEFCRAPGTILDVLPHLRDPATRTALARWLCAQLRHPWTYAFLVVSGLIGAYIALGPYEIPLGGQALRIRSAETLADVAYWLVFLRLFTAWLRVGRAWLAARSTWAVTIVHWHIWPTAMWFLLPKRLGLFVWYLTRNHGPGEGHGLVGRFSAYASALATDYVPGMPVLIAIAVLTVATFFLARRLRPGSAFLLWFVAVSAGLTLMQPTCRSRFLHSWIAMSWVTAGLGLALCIYGWRADWMRSLRDVAAGVAVGLLLLAAAPSAIGPGRALEGGPHAGLSCVLPVAESLLPQLDGDRRVAILSDSALRFFVSWTHQERCRRTERVIGEVYLLPSDPAEFERWAAKTQCDAVVWIDVPEESPLWFPCVEPGVERVRDLMAHQHGFAQVGRCDWPELHCSAVIWRRSGSVASTERR
jgi:hypothetical protein